MQNVLNPPFLFSICSNHRSRARKVPTQEQNQIVLCVVTELRDVKDQVDVHCCREVENVSGCIRESLNNTVGAVVCWHELGGPFVMFLHIVIVALFG